MDSLLGKREDSRDDSRLDTRVDSLLGKRDDSRLDKRDDSRLDTRDDSRLGPGGCAGLCARRGVLDTRRGAQPQLQRIHPSGNHLTRGKLFR